MTEENTSQTPNDRHALLLSLGKTDSRQTTDTEATESKIVGDHEANSRKAAQRLRWQVIGFLALLALGIWLIGRAQNRSLWLFSKSTTQSVSHNIEFVEARDGVVLMVENQPPRSTIYLQVAGETGWRNISMSDFTVKNPVLSPSGKQVAYLSEWGMPHIVVASMASDKKRYITMAIVHDSLGSKKLQLQESSICSWSDVKWSPDETQLAFFACHSKSSNTYAIVSDLKENEPTVVWVENTKFIDGDNRNLIWLDSKTLLISSYNQSANYTMVETVKIR